MTDFDRDSWTITELSEGDAYAIDLRRVIEKEIVKVQSPNLDQEKTATVKMVVLMEMASRFAQHQLSIGGDDFAVYALDVFNKTSLRG
jgi:hypothetical protein